MSKITLRLLKSNEVEIPSEGFAVLYVDKDDGKWKTKLDDGTVKEVIYSTTGPPVDKNHTTPFTATDTIPVTHNLGKIPSVVVIDDSTKKSIKGEITYDGADMLNKLTVRLTEAKSGIVVCN